MSEDPSQSLPNPTESIPPGPGLPPTGSPPVRPVPWGFWASSGWVLLIGFASVIVVAVAMVAWAIASGDREVLDGLRDENGFALALSTVSMLPVCVGGTLLAAWVRGWPAREYLGLSRPDRRQAGRYLVGLAILLVLQDGLTLLAGRSVVPDFMVHVYRTAGFLPFLVAAIVVSAPVSEELVFRGFLFRGYAASRLGPPGAVVVTGVFFGLMHTQYDWAGMLAATITGLYLGYVRWQTGSTLLTCSFHAVMNAVATIECVVAVEWMGRA